MHIPRSQTGRTRFEALYAPGRSLQEVRARARAYVTTWRAISAAPRDAA